MGRCHHGGTTIANSAGVLTIASGVTAGGLCREMLSKETFTIPFRAWFALQSERPVKQTTITSSKPSRSIRLLAFPMASTACSSILAGAATRDCHQHAVLRAERWFGSLASAASAILTTATYSVIELEPFSDECYFHSRPVDSPSGRANSYVRINRSQIQLRPTRSESVR